MGAWDIGPFDNDDAADWLAEFERAPSWAALERALLVGRAQRGNLEAPEASVIIAAAAVVGAARAGGIASLPTENAEAILALGRPSDEICRLALEALASVQTDSELYDLWNEGGDASAWVATLDAIRADLTG